VFLPLRDHGPKPRIALATLTLATINLAVFLLQTLLPSGAANRLLYAGGAIPYEIARLADVTRGPFQVPALLPPPLTILTSLFLHGSIIHLAGNVWFLWVFGRSVEAAMGAARFTFFYLMCGVLAALGQVVMTPGSMTPMVGASGAIAGVLGAYLVLYPRARVELLLFLVVFLQIVVVPAALGLGVWFLWQIVGHPFDLSVATFAHIGGFVAGAALCKLFARAPAAGSPALTTSPWTLSPNAASESWSSPP
jgi:membrane associated rhomboid family serine protease